MLKASYIVSGRLWTPSLSTSVMSWNMVANCIPWYMIDCHPPPRWGNTEHVSSQQVKYETCLTRYCFPIDLQSPSDIIGTYSKHNPDYKINLGIWIVYWSALRNAKHCFTHDAFSLLDNQVQAEVSMSSCWWPWVYVNAFQLLDSACRINCKASTKSSTTSDFSDFDNRRSCSIR